MLLHSFVISGVYCNVIVKFDREGRGCLLLLVRCGFDRSNGWYSPSVVRVDADVNMVVIET